jgi:hypothetical protein
MKKSTNIFLRVLIVLFVILMLVSVFSRNLEGLTTAPTVAMLPDDTSAMNDMTPSATTMSKMNDMTPSATTMAPMNDMKPSVATMAPMNDMKPSVATMAPMNDMTTGASAAPTMSYAKSTPYVSSTPSSTQGPTTAPVITAIPSYKITWQPPGENFEPAACAPGYVNLAGSACTNQCSSGMASKKNGILQCV